MKKLSNPIEWIPPYCPNPRCLFHLETKAKFFVKNGWTRTAKPPFLNQRFKCRDCGQQFSENTFKCDFRKRLANLSENVLQYSMNGMSNNSIARLLKVSEGTVRDRLKYLARQALFFEKEHYPKKINEDVAYDGFETFTYSQFSPCYVNTAVGKNSMFVYHNTFSPLNRKGRMTNEQKIKNQEMIHKFGSYPSDSVYQETIYIFQNLNTLGANHTLYSDQHKAYARAVRSFNFTMKHEKISSNRRRDPSNPLFAVNHLHLTYRHFFSSQKRETIAFQKHEAALLEKIQIMKIYRNFMRSKFVKKTKFDSHAHEWSPAMYIGVADKILNFEEVYGIRRLKTQIILDDRENSFIGRHYPYSRQIIAP